jgi:uncharacterized protein DUF4255
MVNELTLIKDVGDTLAKILAENVNELQFENSISFGPPPPDEPSQNGLSLFLYLVSENLHLKNQEFEMDGPDKLHYPPLTLDLYYLLTPFSKAGDLEAQGVEMMILANVMRTLHDNSILRGPSLGDSLLESGNTELRVVLNDISIEQLYQLWTMFKDTKYRLAVSYLVTPLIIPSSRELTARRVITKQLDFYQERG